MTGSRPIAGMSRRLAGAPVRPRKAFVCRSEITLRGPNPKARLLELCARIGYTPHASLQS